jgi:hypothetical protein
MRPLTQEEFERRKHLEQIGHAGQVVDSMAKDPWGAIGAGLIILAGVGLCFVPIPGAAVVGAGILIGAGTSTAFGVATGTLHPRTVALGGIAGGLSAGVGSAAGGWLAGSGMPALLARMGAGALAGGVVNTGMQLALGGRFNWTSMAESTTVTALGAGMGPKLGSLLSRVLSRSSAETDEFVNLAGQARTTHILDGEIRSDGSFGGGHRPGTGFPLKSEFPTDWSDARIMHYISDVATDPTSTFNPGRGGDIWAKGTRQGVDITVLLRRGEIWTGYPTNLPLNPPP